jgi:hypothetical protein
MGKSLFFARGMFLSLSLSSATRRKRILVRFGASSSAALFRKCRRNAVEGEIDGRKLASSRSQRTCIDCKVISFAPFSGSNKTEASKSKLARLSGTELKIWIEELKQARFLGRSSHRLRESIQIVAQTEASSELGPFRSAEATYFLQLQRIYEGKLF